MLEFTLGYDQASLAAIAQLPNFEMYLTPEISNLLSEAGDLITQDMVAKTFEVFANPTGNLADSISYALASPVEIIISVDVPYSRRMEEGFVGTDSIGRAYDESGKPYAQPALDENRELIEFMFSSMLDSLVAKIAAGEG